MVVMDLGLQNKVVLVTGGSKGIGQGIAKAFSKEGARVAVIARTKVEMEGIASYSADLTNKEERNNVFNTFLSDFGSIDILINNVGGSNGTSVMETDLDTFEKAMDLNYYSAVHMSQLAAAHMKKNHSGSIVNISSIFGRESGGKVTYNNAKAALISFTKSFSREVIKDGIRVNSIAPGSILHPTGNWQRRLDENPDKINQFVENEIPAGRFGTVEEVANAVVFLSSEKASWIVGATIPVDGGQSRANF
jgi:3-oxoacyl-[acyl-carrier protein] reductase